MEDKKKAADNISLFLKTWFATMEALQIEFSLTKDHGIIIKHQGTGLYKKYTPAELGETYSDWLNDKGVN